MPQSNYKTSSNSKWQTKITNPWTTPEPVTNPEYEPVEPKLSSRPTIDAAKEFAEEFSESKIEQDLW